MRIEHIAMYVKDLERAKGFFVTYFGAAAGPLYHNTKTDFRSYFLSFSDGARLEIMNKAGITEEDKQTEKNGFHHIAFSLGSKAAVDALTERMRNDGHPVISGPRTTGDGYYESCLLDLEGNQIELTV